MLQPVKYARKPFYVDAVEVTAENMQEVAEWCSGTLEESQNEKGGTGEFYVKVRVHRPLTERQTKAFIGDRVLYSGNGYKVYTPRAFEKSFEKVHILTREQAVEAGVTPPIEPKSSPMPKPSPPPQGRVDPAVPEMKISD